MGYRVGYLVVTEAWVPLDARQNSEIVPVVKPHTPPAVV
jgi:hypothetical protein